MATKKKTRAGTPARPVDPSTAPVGDPRIARLRELVSVLEGSTLAELSYEDTDVSVTLVRTPRGAVASSPTGYVPAPAAPPASGGSAASVPAPAAADPNVVVVKSPFVGTFYRAPKPGLPNFTDVGEKVHRGKTLCIVEAMKLMNEIESEVDGTIIEVTAENGHAVQYGDTLFRIRKG